MQDLLSPDDLYGCLEFVLSFYNIPSDLEGLIAQSAVQKSNLSPLDLLKVTEKVGLHGHVKPLNFQQIVHQNLPSLLIQKDQKQCVVILPQNTHPGKIFVPGQGVVEADINTYAESYSGQAVIFESRNNKTLSDISHMKKGHALDWFWSPIWHFWKNYTEVLICSVFINLFVLASPLFTLNVYDRVIPNSAMDTLSVLTIGILLALLFDFTLKIIRNFILEHIAANVGKKHDFDLMERILMIRDQDLNLSIGEKVNIFRELQNIRDFYAAQLAPTIVDLPFLLFFLFVIFLICPPLVLVPLTGATLIFVINFFAKSFINRLTEKYFVSMQKKSTVLVETLVGASTFRTFNAVGSRLFKWNAAVDQATDIARHNQFISSTVNTLSVTIMQMVSVFVVFFGVFQINEGNLTIGGIIACNILAGRSMGPIMSLASFLGKLKQAQDLLTTVDKIFQLPHEGESTKALSAKDSIKGRFELQNVVYFYPNQPRPAIKINSLILDENEKIGLIGRSGAGKSTLTKLIAHEIHHYEGDIWLDQYSLPAITPSELRRHIGIVPQHPFFFNGAVHDNIVMGRDDISKENLERAIDIAGVKLVFQDSGYGLDMEIRENGDNLTGGQRQAISLARGLVHDPKILIFDEPTTGMDQVLENHVKTRLKTYLKDKSFIMITHRTSLLSLVDRLILLDKGRVLADGPTDEIIKKLSS